MTMNAPSAAPTASRLECEGLSVRHADGRLALDDLSLCIGSGEIVGVAGVEKSFDRWLTGQYLKLLKSARAVLDYSVDNLTVLRDGGIPLDRLFHVPLDVDPGLLRPDPGPRRGVLFYGDVSSPRRQRILSRLATVIPELRIETALFGPALDQALREAAGMLAQRFTAAHSSS